MRMLTGVCNMQPGTWGRGDGICTHMGPRSFTQTPGAQMCPNAALPHTVQGNGVPASITEHPQEARRRHL